MEQQYRSRNAPIINPFDQLPTPVFDAFVEDISVAIKNALNPHSVPVTSYSHSKINHPQLRVPAPRFLSTPSSRDTDDNGDGDETGDGIHRDASISHPLRSTQPHPAASSRAISDDSPVANSIGESSHSISPSRTPPIVVDLVSDASEAEEESVAEDEEAEEESDEGALKYSRHGSGELVDSNEAGSSASSSSNASGEEESEEQVPDDTFEMHEPPRVLSSFKGKARAADEGPGVRALRGISARLQSLPHQMQPIPVTDGDEEDAEEDSVSWDSDNDNGHQSNEQIYSQRDDSDEELLYANGHSFDERDSNGADDSSKTSGDIDASSDGYLDRAGWKEELYDNKFFPSPTTSSERQEMITMDDSPSPDLGTGGREELHGVTHTFQFQSAIVSILAGDNSQFIPAAAEQPHQFFSDGPEAAPQISLAQDVVEKSNEADDMRGLEPSFETITPQWGDNDIVNIIASSVPMDNLVTGDEYADEDTGDYGAVGESLLPLLQAETDYAFNTAAEPDLYTTIPQTLHDHSAQPPSTSLVTTSEQDPAPTSTSLSFMEQQSASLTPVNLPVGQRSDMPVDQVSRDVTRTPSPLPPSFAVWPHTRDPTPLSPDKPVTEAGAARPSSVGVPGFMSTTFPLAAVDPSEPSTETNAVTGIAETDKLSNGAVSPGDLPDPTLPPPPTDLAAPPIPNATKHPNAASPSVVVQRPSTQQLPIDSSFVGEVPLTGVGQETPSTMIVNEQQSTSADIPDESNRGALGSVADGQDLPEPGLSPPVNIALLANPLEMEQQGSTLPPSIVLHLPSSAGEGDAGASHGISPRKSPRASPMPDSQVIPPPPNPTIPQVPEPPSGDINVSPGVAVQPPTTPPASPPASVRTARMTSPALNAARRLPLSARIGALRRSVSGSSTTEEASSVFVTPRSPVSLVEAQTPLSEAALNIVTLQTGMELSAPHRTDSLEVAPPTSATQSDGTDLIPEGGAVRFSPIPSTSTPRRDDVEFDVGAPVDGTIEINGADDQATPSLPDHDGNMMELDAHPVPEAEAQLPGQMVSPTSPRPEIVRMEAEDPHETPLPSSNQTGSIGMAVGDLNGTHDNEVPWLEIPSKPPSKIALSDSASEVGELLAGTAASSSGNSQAEQPLPRRSTRKRKRNDSLVGSDITTTTAPSPAAQTKSPAKSKPPSRLPRGTIKVPSAVDESETRSTTSRASGASRASRVSRRKPRAALTVQLPAIHHFHNHRHPPSSASDASSPPSPTVTQSTTGLVTRSQCGFHKISAPGLVPGTSVFFIVPRCALDAEKMADENILDCGLASAEDNANKITDVSQLPTDLASVLRKLVGPHLMLEAACGYLPSPALQDDVYDGAAPPEDIVSVTEAEDHDPEGTGPPRTPKSAKSSPGKRSGRKRVPRRSDPHGDLGDYVPPSDADSATDTETNTPRHRRKKHGTGLDLAASSMDPGGLLSLGGAPNADTNTEAGAEESATAVAPTHDSASPVTPRRNRGRKRRRNSDVMAYKPGAECEESDDEEGASDETSSKAKRRRASHQKHKPSGSAAAEHEGQSLSMSVEIPHSATSMAAATATDHGVHLPPADVAVSPPKKARKWWRFGLGNKNG